MADPPRPRPPSGRPGLFLARDSYRQRRLRDAARMLPVLGIVAWLIPLLWRREPGQVGDVAQFNGVSQTGGTAAAVVFVFAAWVLLIVLAALIARHLRPDGTSADPPG